MNSQRKIHRLKAIYRRYLWAQRVDYARLQAEANLFEIELSLLEKQTTKDKVWVESAHRLLHLVRQYLEPAEPDIEAGWACLHAARRASIYGLTETELKMHSILLCEEAKKIDSNWRANGIKSVLSLADQKPYTPDLIICAMTIRDEHFSNQYRKIWLVGHQLSILLSSLVLETILLSPLVVFYSRHLDGTLAPWGYQMVCGILFFGLLGASFSAGGSLMNNNPNVKVPERVANQFVTISRTFFGGGLALAGYALYLSKGIELHLVGANEPSASLAVAFLFGFGGERLITNVLGALSPSKS